MPFDRIDRAVLDEIATGVKIIMADLTKLNAAVATLTAGFVTLDQSIQAEITALQDATANSDQPGVDTATANIAALSAKMAADATALAASLAVPVPPSPAPAAAPAPSGGTPGITTGGSSTTTPQKR